jgi:hypothetical protein
METTIDTNDVSEAVSEFHKINLPENSEFVELVSVEDENYNDIMSEFRECGG